MKRFNGIDTIRGISMWMMVAGHIMDWWIRTDLYWHKIHCYAILEPICSTGFLFASGISAALSYRSSISRIDTKNSIEISRVRNEYLFRAFFILVIGFIYNLFVALIYGNIYSIWGWYVLQTIGFSLIFAWPLLNTSFYFRLILAFIILSLNPIIFSTLSAYEGKINLFGIIYHILYHPADQYTILSFFSVFLIGTILGDILFKVNIITDEHKEQVYLKTKFIYPTLFIGGLLIIFGILFRFSEFLEPRSLSSFLYSLGVILVLLSILIALQEFKFIKTKKSYKFLFYYSYYSFTIYLGHNILVFIFPAQLDIFFTWLAIIITTALIGVLLNFAYKKLKRKISVKALIGIISYLLAKKIEAKSEKKLKQVNNIEITEF